MQSQSWAVEEIFLLVVDTNVLLHQLDALQQFVLDIEHHLPFTLQIIIPWIVISELDRYVYSAIILAVNVPYH
jgi:predicted ribonuclease YlaK